MTFQLWCIDRLLLKLKTDYRAYWMLKKSELWKCSKSQLSMIYGGVWLHLIFVSGEVIKKYKTRTGRGSGENVRNNRTPPPPDDRTWFSDILLEEDQYDITLSHKLMLLCDILKTCEMAGDKLLLFSQSLMSLTLIEDTLGMITEAKAQKWKVSCRKKIESEKSFSEYTFIYREKAIMCRNKQKKSTKVNLIANWSFFQILFVQDSRNCLRPKMINKWDFFEKVKSFMIGTPGDFKPVNFWVSSCSACFFFKKVQRKYGVWHSDCKEECLLKPAFAVFVSYCSNFAF